MIVRIRFGRGRLVTRRKGKNGRAALLLASLLSLVSISLAVLGFWRLGQDLDFLGNFIFSTGLLSHWQIWLGAAAATQYGVWRLTRYSKIAKQEATLTVDEESSEDESSRDKIAARV